MRFSIFAFALILPTINLINGKPVAAYDSINIASDQSIVLVVSVDGLPANSLVALKSHFRLISLENKHQFTEIKLLMKCQFGYGHNYFSAQICN